MRTGDATSLALRCCLFSGVALLAAGLALSEQGAGETVMWLGALALIASPFVGVVVTLVSLAAERDRVWALVAAALAAMIAAFLALTVLMG
ncbi:MAG: DUF1634 domain-containing protein [Methanomassiliicoccaceae archaeon]|nr:DUF1634 domain-containing protein [Methanomassiliicoccaceae archaeon]